MDNLKLLWLFRRKNDSQCRNFIAIALFIITTCFTSCGTGGSKPGDQAEKTTDANVSHEHTDLHAGKMDAAQILSMLKAGNENFVKRLSPGNVSHDSSYNYFDQIQHTGSEQHPVACILTCMDSRVPPEIIFEQGIGNLFVLRVAGNIEDQDMLGSMEYAVDAKHVPLIIVMGHKNCGAIQAAFSKLDTTDRELVSLISQVKKDVIPDDQPPYDASAKHNVKLTIDNILKHSTSIRKKHDSGEVLITGALYDVATGRVDWNFQNW